MMVYERRNPNDPWLTSDMIKILSTYLRPTDIGLEFGSGRSTLWFAKRINKLTSVEHDQKWFGIVKNQLHQEPKLNVDYRLCEDGIQNDAATDYVNICSTIPSESLDFVLIDGVARDHCALASLDKIRSGGILIVDNVNWFFPRPVKVRSVSPNSRRPEDGYASDAWSHVGTHIADWRFVWTSNGVTDTAFWVKP